MTAYTGPVIDCCVNHTWSNQLELMDYMSSGWREFLGRPNRLPNGGGMISIAAGNPYRRPRGDKRRDSRPANDQAEGSDYDHLVSQCLGKADIRQVVLGFDTGALAPALLNPHAGAEICRAANDWTIDRWLTREDDRLTSLMLVQNQVPDIAAAEIRRVGVHPKIVGILMGGNGLARPFGHPAYHPIYGAAAELGLPIVVKAGAEVVPDSLAQVAATGEPCTYAEFRILSAQPLMTHVSSMITQGVFEKFPGLRILVIGGGVLWIPALLWRFDTNYQSLRREVPWVKRLPSEYFQEHVRVGTVPLDKLSPPAFLQAIRLIDRADDILCFASGYPDWDSDDASNVALKLPPEWRQKIMHDNGHRLFTRQSVMGSRVVQSSLGMMHS
jgi:predicted TIM-barrel fold metal-dependent hydrolase